MSDTAISSRVNPWLALWFRPRVAIDAVLSQNRTMTSLVIAVAVAVLPALAAVGKIFNFADARLDPTALAIIASIVLAVVVMAILGFYVCGWVLNAVARSIGGRGAAAGTRAAWAWS